MQTAEAKRRLVRQVNEGLRRLCTDLECGLLRVEDLDPLLVAKLREALGIPVTIDAGATQERDEHVNAGWGFPARLHS